jgi:hypothetical protein
MKEKIKIFCKVCGAYVNAVTPGLLKTTKRTCSKECYVKLVKNNTSGKNNGNYRHGVYNEGRRCPKCGGHRSINSKEYCRKCSPQTGNDNGFYGKHHTQETLNIISKASREKFTPELHQSMRQKFEETGRWLPLSKKTPYRIYFAKCNFVKDVLEHLDPSDFNKIKDGFYNESNGENYVKDHKYSRWSGFNNNVPPIILRHPANCQILTKSQNMIKMSKNSLTLDELIAIIKAYKKTWYEQEKCLKEIKIYENAS